MERKNQLLRPEYRGKYVEGVFINSNVPFGTTIFCITCQTSFFQGDPKSIGDLAAEQIAMQHGKALHHTIYRASKEVVL